MHFTFTQGFSSFSSQINGFRSIGQEPITVSVNQRIENNCPSGILKNKEWRNKILPRWIIKDYAYQDGVEKATEDGTVLFSDIAKQADESVDPRLCEPLTLDDCLSRWRLLMSYIDS